MMTQIKMPSAAKLVVRFGRVNLFPASAQLTKVGGLVFIIKIRQPKNLLSCHLLEMSLLRIFAFLSHFLCWNKIWVKLELMVSSLKDFGKTIFARWFGESICNLLM